MCPVGGADSTYFWLWAYTYQVIEDLVTDDTCHLKALLAGDRVDNDVTVDADEVLRVEDAVLILQGAELLATSSRQAWVWVLERAQPCPEMVWVLHAASGARDRDAMRGEKKSSKYLTSRIYNLGCKVLVLVPDHLAECVLNGRVVAVDKVAINELHRQTRLACIVRQSGTSHMLPMRSRKPVPSSTHQQLYCRQWRSFFAWAPACCCWLSGEGVRKRFGSPVLRFGCLSRSLRRSCLGCACFLRFPGRASSLGMTPWASRSR
jgi:hypothetical protein